MTITADQLMALPSDKFARVVRIEWPDQDRDPLIYDAREHVAQPQANVADARNIDPESTRITTCQRRCVINYVRTEHSWYETLKEKYPHLRQTLRDRTNLTIAQHYPAIRCECGRCKE